MSSSSVSRSSSHCCAKGQNESRLKSLQAVVRGNMRVLTKHGIQKPLYKRIVCKKHGKQPRSIEEYTRHHDAVMRLKNSVTKEAPKPRKVEKPVIKEKELERASSEHSDFVNEGYVHPTLPKATSSKPKKRSVADGPARQPRAKRVHKQSGYDAIKRRDLLKTAEKLGVVSPSGKTNAQILEAITIRFNELENANRSLVTRLEKKSKDLVGVKDELSDKNDELYIFCNQLAQLNKKYKALFKSSKETDAKERKLARDLESLKGENARLISSISKLKAELDLIKELNREVSDNYAELKKFNSKLFENCQRFARSIGLFHAEGARVADPEPEDTSLSKEFREAAEELRKEFAKS